ncbi:hypothetical protein KGQ71_04970, partial [Patescibacteria group bacterium]|nr:hypothetical protein [Patescibacteria group bacterium]
SQLGSTPMRLAEELEGTNAGLIYTSITDALDLREKKFSTAIQGVGIKSYADVRAFRDSWTSLRGDIQQAELEASAMSKLKVETTTDSITELFRHLGIVEQFDPDYIIHNQTEEQQAGITSLAIAVNPPHVNGVIFNYPKGARGAGSGQTAHELAHMAYGMYAPENGTYAEKFGITGTANETMAFLIESLFSNRRWLYHVYGMSEQESNLIASRSQLGDELFLREYVGGLGFQLELERMERSLEGGIYTQEGDFKPEVYAAFRSSLGKAYAGRLQLSDDDLRSRYSKFLMPKLEYLIAFAASEFLSEYLEERWGKEWFENPEAGDLLKGVMKDLHVKGIEEVLSGLPHPYGSSRHFNESNYTSLIQVRYQM